MLLNIYLVTTAISWATSITYSIACEKKLKRMGYKYVKEKKSIPETIADIMSTAFKGSIPVYNIINTVVILCMGDKVYDYMENEFLENGTIYMPTEENSTCAETNIYTENIEKTNSEKNFDEMTTKEKLDYLHHEKEIILANKHITTVSQPINSDSIDESVKDKENPVYKKTMNLNQK